ncbi:fimbria/pilus outer membrane usher protein [Sphingomonas glacialis]|uniref:fimbria/pilus outer membrane usher protein n=1 Tax=Sphingomonas glacialis TaxID=658225 RepID=UPI0011293082|nr:fimbria/pilus outer membrane usher protein [Sphingomonas glacialis]
MPTVLTEPATKDDVLSPSSTGFTLNYDLDATAVGTARLANGLFEARLFSPWGRVSSGLLARIVRGGGTRHQTSAIRLDTVYSYSDRATLRRYRIGDFITGALSWTRPVRMGGAQITADFSTRPDLITFPLPSLSGSVAVPSTVDILENGSRLFSREVAAGPFEVPQLPVITGAGTLSITVRDALGRQVTVTQPFYASATLLAPGLQTFSLQAGAVRRNWGVKSNDYAGLATSGTWRRGLSAMATVEASIEATRGAAMGGAGLVLNLAQIAILNIVGAASTGGTGTGTKVTAGLQRVGRVFSFAASATLVSRGFRDVAAVTGDPVARLQVNTSTGLTLGRLGSLGVAFVAVNRDAYVSRDQTCPASTLGSDCSSYGLPAQRTRTVSASYSVQLGRIALYATAYGDLRDRRTRGVIAGLTLPLGQRSTASVSAGAGGGDRYGQFDLSRSPSTIGDWGYRAYVSVGSAPHQFGQLQYKAPWALLTAGADHIAGQTSLRGALRGSLSLVDGGVFAANAIDDSFAVVDTDGLPNIRVFHENRAVGRTNAHGLLLVPELRAFDLNHIGIEATDIPPDIAIETDARAVRPPDHAGVIVKFPARISSGALLILVDAAGVAIPVGSTATLRQTGVIAPVGYDGQSYLTGLQAHNVIDVGLANGSTCSLAFAYHATAGELPTIGPISCTGPAK